MGRITTRRRVTRYTLGERTSRRDDRLIAEEPLEIRVDGSALAVTMRTPGNDIELALGFLVAEGIVRHPNDVRTARLCASDAASAGEYNVVDVALAEGVAPPPASSRHAHTMTSACGLCGKDSIEAVTTRTAHPVTDDPIRFDADWLSSLPGRMRDAQTLFDRTGALHAAALVDVAADEMLVVREDVGRHNAVDKVIGWAVGSGRLPLPGTVLVVSGRAGFELVQKATMAGIPALAAVSAPTELAVALAEEAGLTLAGFVRGASMVVYAGDERIDDSEESGSREAGEPETTVIPARSSAS